ncbi:hypothetical protein Acor_56350 [Acrocarpospora corrugata]|uniref:Uncharacterized protein n=1 Tax=Acrocarpospora corrugata TaxID=35763 RepID=A0A5M3W5I7_9ACTN|nr:hypothetical protein [Acrocarpospora corrugata]GES03569.1 hypothetical protein Acor_56350 [Acrocarpospora corrugata]
MTQDDSTPPSSAPARESLAAARELATTTARRGAAVGAVTTAAVGVLVAGALAAASLFTPERPVVFVVLLAIYGIAMTLLMVWHHRKQVVAHSNLAESEGTCGRVFGSALKITI